MTQVINIQVVVHSSTSPYVKVQQQHSDVLRPFLRVGVLMIRSASIPVQYL